MILEPSRSIQSNRDRGELKDSHMFNVCLPNRSVELKADGSGIEVKHEGILVTPKPGFVLKTFSRTNLKVFINVCFHDFIEKQSTKKKLDKNGEEVEGLNLPLSMGPIRFCNDKNGNSSLVVDAIMNTNTRDAINSDKSGCHRDFVCQLLIDCFDQKYKDFAYLDRQYKLPNMMYIGFLDTRTGDIVRKKNEFTELCKQMVKDTRNVPKIEEIPSKLTHTSIQDLTKPDFTFEVALSNKQVMDIDEYIDNYNHMSQLLKFPKWDGRLPICFSPLDLESIPKTIIATAVIDVNDFSLISVQVSSFLIRICLEAQKHDTVLPLYINTHDVKSTFDEATSTLKMILGVNQIPIEDSPDPGSQQWSFVQGLSKRESKNDQSSNTKYPSKPLDEVDDPYHLQPIYSLKKFQSTAYLDSKNVTLPEDEFHSKDYISQYNKQRQQEECSENISNHESENNSKEKNDEESIHDIDDECDGYSCMTDEDRRHMKLLKEVEMLVKADGGDFFENDLWYRLL